MTQSSKIPYIKPHCTYDQQLNALVKQGMVFDVAESQAWQSDNIASKKLYNTQIIMVWMLNTIEPEHTWTHRLTSLLNKYGIRYKLQGKRSVL